MQVRTTLLILPFLLASWSAFAANDEGDPCDIALRPIHVYDGDTAFEVTQNIDDIGEAQGVADFMLEQLRGQTWGRVTLDLSQSELKTADYIRGELYKKYERSTVNIHDFATLEVNDHKVGSGVIQNGNSVTVFAGILAFVEKPYNQPADFRPDQPRTGKILLVNNAGQEITLEIGPATQGFIAITDQVHLNRRSDRGQMFVNYGNRVPPKITRLDSKDVYLPKTLAQMVGTPVDPDRPIPPQMLEFRRDSVSGKTTLKIYGGGQKIYKEGDNLEVSYTPNSTIYTLKGVDAIGKIKIYVHKFDPMATVVQLFGGKFSVLGTFSANDQVSTW